MSHDIWAAAKDKKQQSFCKLASISNLVVSVTLLTLQREQGEASLTSSSATCEHVTLKFISDDDVFQYIFRLRGKTSPAKQTDPGFLSGSSSFSSSPPVVKQTVSSSSSSSSHRQVRCENPALRQNGAKRNTRWTAQRPVPYHSFHSGVFFVFNLEPPARCGIIILLAGELTAWTSTRQDRLGWAAGPGSALPRC